MSRQNNLKRRFLLIIVLVGISFVLISCDSLMEDPVGDALMLEAITSIENRDTDILKSLFLQEVTERDGFDEQIELIINNFTGSMISWEKVSQHTTRVTGSQGSTTVNAVYRVTKDTGVYVVLQTRREFPTGESGLSRFTLSRDEQPARPVGYLSDWRDFNIFNWMLLLLNVLTYATIVMTLVHCIRSKLRNKLPLAILILVQGGVSVTNLPTMFRVNFAINILNRSILLTTDSGFTLVILLPLGAIIYWFIRKKFEISDKDETSSSSQENETKEES